jgi:2-polyprenyl-6-hydroxyphenyl methylase/3-demethylubiquinone-9 3-methyltransferase
MQSEANVDLPEIEKFDALAHRWWDPNGDFKPFARHQSSALGLHS